MKLVTIHNLKDCTLQEVFDFIVGHLYWQGRPSRDEITGQCMYRTGGLTCAAGCLVPIVHYRPDNEGKRWSATSWGMLNFPKNILIESLQAAHDDKSFLLAANLEKVALEWRLSFDRETDPARLKLEYSQLTGKPCSLSNE